jgi:hypothetical protein
MEVWESMNRKFEVIAIVLVIIMLSLPVLGEMNSGDSSGNSADSGNNNAGSVDSGKSNAGSADSGNNNAGSVDSGKNDAQSGDSSGLSEKAREMYDNGSRMREDNGMMGMGFMQREDNNYGNYVTFSVDNTTGDVLNFGISGTSLFDSIKIPGFNFKDTITRGTETEVVSKDGSIVIHIHDNPAAVIEINAEAKANLIFNLASGVSATKQDNMVKITARNDTAYIVSEKATSINIAGSQVSIDTTNGDTIFRASPVNMPLDNMEMRFMEEVKTKKAGAEVSVGKSDNYSIVNYSGDVNVTMGSIETGHVRMEINSSDHSGKFILMNFDNSSLMWNEGQNLNLYLDNKTMKEVETEKELYNASESSFWLNTTGKNKMQALVYISNFSTHQIDVVVGAQANQTSTQIATPGTTTNATTPGTATPTPTTPGFEIALGALGTMAAAYIARRKH